MKIGFIGLGKMGYNMVLNLIDHKQKVVAYNRSPQSTKKVSRHGAIPSYNIEELVLKLPKQKIIWLMVPAGKPVDENIKALIPHLKKGDIIIDGGNSYFKDSQKRYNKLKKKGIHYIDVGTSGGKGGARHGACMMIGGDKSAFKITEQLYKAMCIKNGYGYMGSNGAGHFVKMVHNGIEYGMMGAIAEGIEAIHKHEKSFGTKLQDAVRVYAHGSIISGNLMSWMQDAFDKKGFLEQISGKVPKGATEDEMKNLEGLANMKILHQARLMRIKTRKKPNCVGQLISAMRNEFGGHVFNKSDGKKIKKHK